MESEEDLASTLSHDELLEITQSSLATLLSKDSFLKDLPNDIIIEEILSQIAVEHGQSITIFISRESEPTLKVIIRQDAKVRDLKKAIQRHFELYQKRAGIKTKISWKYIWKTYNLNFDSIALDDNNANIQDYGVTNKVTLIFKKRKKQKKIV
ncbi:U11/U12 small nuclear ribonucleoprotein 25 kDa protein-like [Spodoptera litura]|uniref:U11/U12 small nuclear ribonucleoprotein 25 kDa protein-like n=1 Tax=Spodoptera litura TaxID=69820 RepID=A0A9J7IMY0_SPOLT|nr:U11/U12 small nuclear ribonucleoprotein 25 kDa protein-like [Spodoptera litura]